jgi:hypothetical protein
MGRETEAVKTPRSQQMPDGETTSAIAYAVLLAAQTVLASLVFMIVIPIFREMISHLGETLDIDAHTFVLIIGAAVVLQCFYWIRFCWVPIVAPFQSVIAEHVLLFVSRASFFFGGALFSMVFFRHVPSLTSFPPFAELCVKLVCLFGSLFALFCYSLELERLARAMSRTDRRL